MASVIAKPGIPSKLEGTRVAFRCPECGNYQARMSPNRNLVRCFRCVRNFNPIDLVMTERQMTFLEAVEYLEELLCRM
jgi:predicted RNA-binding Zn-ribbon protein involved in translation (DUF1610 family)